MTEEVISRRRSRFSGVGVLSVILLVLLYFFLNMDRRVQELERAPAKGLGFLWQVWGPNQNDFFDSPANAAVDRLGRVYVTDTGNNRVAVFNRQGKFIRQFKTMEYPIGIAVVPDGSRVYVGSKMENYVAVYDTKGKIRVGQRVIQPTALALKGKRLYIANGFGPLLVTDLNLKLRARWGRYGRRKGYFAWPNGVTVGNDGTAYVSDQNNLRIQALDKKGRVKWVVGKPPVKAFNSKSRQFGLPAGITLGEGGLLYMVDGFHDSIVVLTKKGQAVATLGQAHGRAELEFMYPRGIAYGGRGQFYVVDSGNNRVQAISLDLTAAERSRAGLPADPNWILIVIIILTAAYIFRRWLNRGPTDSTQPLEVAPGN